MVGRDGLPIDWSTADGIDPEGIAAVLPSSIRGMGDIGTAGERGQFMTGVLEFDAGLAIVSVLHEDAMIVILVRPDVNVGSLVFDLRRHRTAIAGLL